MYRMLVVDDNDFDREGVCNLVDWKALGIEVVGTAINGEDGYAKAMELSPDFILTDVSMPRMNGIQMTKKIIKTNPGIRFIYMSCFDEFDYVQNAINLDVCDYVLKPVDLTKLEEAAKKVIA